MRGAGQRLLSRLASSYEACCSTAAVELRPLSTTSAALRITREPLPSDRPASALPGLEKPDLVEKCLSPELLPRRERKHLELRESATEFQRFPGDTGSTEVQVALLTGKIASLAEHLQQHRKDHSSRRGLEAMLTRRRQLLQYLRRTRFDSYAVLLAQLGLKDSYAQHDRYSKRYRPAARAEPGGGQAAA